MPGAEGVYQSAKIAIVGAKRKEERGVGDLQISYGNRLGFEDYEQSSANVSAYFVPDGGVGELCTLHWPRSHSATTDQFWTCKVAQGL